MPETLEVVDLWHSVDSPDYGSTVQVGATLRNPTNRAVTETLELRNWDGDVVASKQFTHDAYNSAMNVSFDVPIPRQSRLRLYLGREKHEIDVGDVLFQGVRWDEGDPAWWTPDPNDEMPEPPGAIRGESRGDYWVISVDEPADTTPNDGGDTDTDSGGSTGGLTDSPDSDSGDSGTDDSGDTDTDSGGSTGGLTDSPNSGSGDTSNDQERDSRAEQPTEDQSMTDIPGASEETIEAYNDGEITFQEALGRIDSGGLANPTQPGGTDAPETDDSGDSEGDVGRTAMIGLGLGVVGAAVMRDE